MEKKKTELWPLGIIGALALFIGGILFGVSLMMKQDVSLVSADYYAKELAYQGRIDKEQALLDDGKQPVIVYSDGEKLLNLTIPELKDRSSFSGTINFVRPSDDTKDFSLDLKPDADGTQRIGMGKMLPGLWTLQIEWTENGKSYYYQEQLSI